jgi:hypothetical protein
MSHVFTKRRPMIDLEEFERRLSWPCSTDQKDGDVLAELLRIIGDKDAPHKTDLEPKTQPSAKVQLAGETAEGKQPDAQVRSAGGDFAAIEAGLLGKAQPQAAVLREADSSTVEHKRSIARAPLISGDFAAIEAGLLGTPREQATAMVPETGIANPFPNLDLRSERRLYQDEPPASDDAGVADGHIRSRRPLYVMMATIIVGMAGIAVSVGFNSRLSDSSDIASVKADDAPDNQAAQATSGAGGPTQDAALGNPPEPWPTPLENGTKQPLDLTQAEGRPVAAVAPIESAAPVESESAAVPSASPRAQTPAEPLSMATPVESEKVGEPPQADVKAAPPPAPQSPASAKAPTAKTGGRVAKPLKPAAAKHPGSQGQPRQIANKAKATPPTPPATKPTPSAGPTADTPTTQPSPATNGAFGLVQSAVDSLTSTTAKLLQWGRN